MLDAPPTPPAVLARIEAFAADRACAATCQAIAKRCRKMARQCYDVGDQRRGDRWTAKGLAWELAAATGNLAEVML